jgi:hypothetical protein
VEFDILGPLPKLYQCHCSLCRKQGGSVSNTALIVAHDHFRWLAGERTISSYVKATGFRSDFCVRCGSPVPNPLRDTPYVWVPAGLLDTDAPLAIAAHLFVGSKAPWDTLPADGVRHDTMPALGELIGLLHSPDN